MLSLRPILCSLISHSGSTNSTDSTHLGPRIAHQCSLVCIKIAQESIDLVYTYRDSTWATTGVLAAWWYNVLFVYSAATVLQAARLRPALEAELARDDISESWNRAIALLEGYGDYSESIPMLVATLNVLVEQVSRRCANPNSKQRDVGGGEEESTRAAGGGLEEAAMQGPEQNTGMFGDSVVIPGVDWESLLNPGSLPWLDYYSLPVDL